jgi:hypothetical protein
MKNLKLELFNYKKTLSYEDQYEISNIIESHMNVIDKHSEKQIILSLNEMLNTFTYDKGVKTLLENLNVDMKQNELLYELKNLYNVLNTKNQGELLRHPINILLQTINLDNDQDRLSKILNELSVHNWVPEINLFVHNLTKSPEQRVNLLSGGKSEPVYTLVDNVVSGKINEGVICLIKDSWFLMTENNIEKTLLETHIKDENRLKLLRTLQDAMNYATITEDRINFRISEYLTLGMSLDKMGVLYINDDEMKETTLESLFSSPIISQIHKNFYPMLVEVAKNTDRFIDMDTTVRKITNLINPYLEIYAFNYKNNNFVYRCDERQGYRFYQYGSAIELVNEVRNELNFDLTFFYENKINKQIVIKKKLEDKERQITLKLEDIEHNLDKLHVAMENIGATEQITKAVSNLSKRKKILDIELQAIKEAQYNEKVIL